MKTSRFRPLFFILLFTLIPASYLNAASDSIRLNQTGFYTHGPKLAVVVEPQTWYFSIRSTDLETVFYQGELTALEKWMGSREDIKRADFSSFTRKGTYVLYVAGIGASYPFVIGDNPLHDVSRGLLRAFYYQRASTALHDSCAGAWSRSAGHPDNYVQIHPSAASDPSAADPRKTNEGYASPKGWYDAGDYGKYVVNAGITTYELLLLYELFPDYFASLNLNIPESDDTLPDILNEIKWELDWLLTMQDPADSGVYHKLTTKNFMGDISPDKAIAQRYFIGKGTAATFNFSAVCAVACRIYKSFLPSFADSCLTAAKSAWQWGVTHPDSAFRNPSGVVTGQYGDRSLRDERQWASFELFIATGDSAYYHAADTLSASANVPDWQKTGILGRWSMALHTGDSTSMAKVISTADNLLATIAKHPYRITISNEFYWGSNGVAANQGNALLIAYILTKDINYLEGAIHASDYLMGRNATGYCFVTGFGRHSPMDPHHRPSIADNQRAPVPGFLVGGPNSQDRSGESCTAPYPSPRAQAYLDHHCSFTTNEVAINWNAAGALLTNGINAVFTSSEYDLSILKTRYTTLDETPPDEPEITVTVVGSDHALIKWRSSEPAVASLTCTNNADDAPAVYAHSPRDTSGEFALAGLHPETVYTCTCYLFDDAGNFASVGDSFKTESSSIISSGNEPVISPAAFSPGTAWKLSTSGITAQSVRVVYTQGGSSKSDTALFVTSGTSHTATLPETAVSDNGLSYHLEYCSDNDTLRTHSYGIAPDAIEITKSDFAKERMYQMVAQPGIFSPFSSYTLRNTFGDTTQWRYFGYHNGEKNYVLFDTVKSGYGGMVYHNKSFDLSRTVGGIAPDAPFPINLERGWNCIGSPFIFDIFWDNTLIEVDGARISIADSVSRHFIFRQFFTWHDSTANNVNDGIYRTNRDFKTHFFLDSARLSPWKSYWIFSEREDITCLLNPSQNRPPQITAKKRSYNRRSWFCALRFSSGDESDGPIVFGSADGARDSFDWFDSPKPPSVSGLLKAGFTHNDWQTTATFFGSDITAYDTENKNIWTTRISAPAYAPVFLNWNFEGVRTGYCYLVDSLSGTTIAMADTGSYLFSTTAASPPVLTFIHSANRLEVHESTGHWSFSTHGTSYGRFSFTIPSVNHTSPVSIVIYDLLGHPVKTLLNESRASGFHTVYWNGTTDRQAPLASGLYIARFMSSGYSKTIRLTIVNR